jgi:heterodisulfide reductase subunit D
MIENDFFNDFSRIQTLQLYACGKCGECLLACPIYEETQDRNLGPAFRIRTLKSLAKTRSGLFSLFLGSRKSNPKEIQKLATSVYDGCTVCGRCMTVCPFNFDLIEIWEKARERVVKCGFGPAPTIQVKEAVEAEKNVYKMPHALRREWLYYEIVEAPQKEKADVVYFVGCTTSYSGILNPIAHAVTSILYSADEDWMMLKDEWCCGSPLKFAGQTEKYKDFVAQNVEAIEATNAKRVVFNCPSCYRRFKEDYPKILGRPLRFELVHIIELIDEYVNEGRIKPAQKLEATVTYHDPCELSRLLGKYEEPRRLLTDFVTTFIEMPENKVNARCCGAGGMFAAINTDLSHSLAKKRVEQAVEIGATILTSSCPACKLVLDEAAVDAESDIQVLDLVEVIAIQLGLMESY